MFNAQQWIWIASSGWGLNNWSFAKFIRSHYGAVVHFYEEFQIGHIEVVRYSTIDSSMLMKIGMTLNRCGECLPMCVLFEIVLRIYFTFWSFVLIHRSLVLSWKKRRIGLVDKTFNNNLPFLLSNWVCVCCFLLPLLKETLWTREPAPSPYETLIFIRMMYWKKNAKMMF